MTAVVAILLVGSISVALGTALVRRPLETTTAAMRRVRDGDLEAMVTHQRRDELGTIASEFNELVGALRRARIDLKEEEERRRTLEGNLARADKLMVVGQLAAGLAHEIGTPLHVVAGRARRIVEHPEAPAEVLRLGKIVVEQTERIARIVDQVVRFSRRTKPERRLIDVREPVQAVLSLLEGEAQRTNVKIVTAMAAAEISIDGDQLQQVTLNLVRNALAATPMGGTITVCVSKTPAGEPRGVLLTVADTGVGVAPEDVERMFEPFFTTRHESGGTGLGLAVVRSIVQAHRGTIGVETMVGRGTIITVTFPAA
jgi:signal transduction histidine kinase